MSSTSVVPDPFTDDLFAPLDDGSRDGSFADQLEIIAAEENPDPTPSPIDPAQAAAPEPKDEPTVHKMEDGSSVTIEHSTKGWKATLDGNTGAQAEVFYGGTKDELLLNLSAGKLKATQKIREMNRKQKLESSVESPTPSKASEELKPLTADEVFDIKTKLNDNPDLGLDTWFQKKTGMTIAEMVAFAKNGKVAADELAAEAVAKTFTDSHPEYLQEPGNFTNMVKWLCKYKLNQNLNGRDPNTAIEALQASGKWTIDNLNEAYEDLLADGLLDIRSEDPPPEVVPAVETKPVAAAPAAATPTNPSGRIASEVRRSRVGSGNLGIRSREVGVAPETSEKPPSVEELDSLSDDAINKLVADVQKLRRVTRR